VPALAAPGRVVAAVPPRQALQLYQTRISPGSPSGTSMSRNAQRNAAPFAEQAAGLARAGGDRADASIEFCLAAVRHVLAGNAPAAVPLAREGLALAREVGAPAIVATALLGMGLSVAGTDPGQARAYLSESREISATVDHHSAMDLIIATGIAFVIRDRAAALELADRPCAASSRAVTAAG
jgi:hypothetical protein